MKTLLIAAFIVIAYLLIWSWSLCRMTARADRGIGRIVSTFPYIWYWRKRHPERKGQPCRVVCRGALNSIMVEFPDGFRTITSRWAVRKRDDWDV